MCHTPGIGKNIVHVCLGTLTPMLHHVGEALWLVISIPALCIGVARKTYANWLPLDGIYPLLKLHGNTSALQGFPLLFLFPLGLTAEHTCCRMWTLQCSHYVDANWSRHCRTQNVNICLFSMHIFCRRFHTAFSSTQRCLSIGSMLKLRSAHCILLPTALIRLLEAKGKATELPESTIREYIAKSNIQSSTMSCWKRYQRENEYAGTA